MTNKIDKQLKAVRLADFKSWSTSLWLVKRRPLGADRIARYSVLRVELDKKLEGKLKRKATERIQDSRFKLEEYDFLTADQDDRLLTLDAADTDFAKIQAEIDQGLNNPKVDKYEDLLDTWAFVLKLEHGNQVIYAVRKVNKFTQAAKVASVSYFLFEDKKLVDLEGKEIFTLDLHIDFFVYEGTAFIANKKEFESAMNFRDGMEKNRDSLLSEFEALKLMPDVEPMRKIVGSNLHLLRKLSAIQKSGYYKNTSFMANLLKVNVQEKWGLVIENGQIVVDESNVELVLTLLNNSRLKSPINAEVFDAAVKKKVG